MVLSHSWPVPDALRKPYVDERMLENPATRANVRCELSPMTTISADTLMSPHPTVADMTVTIEPSLAHRGDLRIHVAGELDICSGPTLAHALIGLWPPVHIPGQHHAEVVLDLHELSFLDSCGLRALEASRRRLLEAGWIVTAGPAQPQVQELLRFADRSGWLTDGPLASEGASTWQPHVTTPDTQLHATAVGGGAPRVVQLPDEPRAWVSGRG